MMWMMLWMLCFWVAVAGAIWLFANRRRDAGGDAIELLRQRLARGEIDVEEFERREKILNQTDRGGRRGGLLALGFAIAIALFVIVPVIALASNGWDMWDMHGRGRNTSNSPVTQGGSHANVRIAGFAFEPGNLEVSVGATVTWTNQDSAPHDATARDADWQTEQLSEGESNTLTFDSRGEYDYYCSIHPSMKAKLRVR